MENRREDKLLRVLYNICGVLLMLMVGVIFIQVIARYIFQNSLSWSEEVGRYLFVWISFLGAALGIPVGVHVSLDILTKRFPPSMQKVFFIISRITMLFFSVVLFRASLLMLELGKKQISTALKIPMRYVYLVLPISAIIMIYYVIRDVADCIKLKGGDGR